MRSKKASIGWKIAVSLSGFKMHQGLHPSDRMRALGFAQGEIAGKYVERV